MNSRKEPTLSRPRAEATCLRALARREYARTELLERLRREGYPEDMSQSLLDDLEQQGLQSDQRFQEALIRRRAAQGYGPLRLQAELRQRGLDADAGRVPPETDFSDALRRAHGKRFGAHAPDSLEERAKRERFLMRRGFARGEISAFLRNLERVPDVES